MNFKNSPSLENYISETRSSYKSSLAKEYDNLKFEPYKKEYLSALFNSIFGNQLNSSVLESTYDKGIFYVSDKKEVKPINEVTYQAIASFLWFWRFVLFLFFIIIYLFIS